MGNKQKIAFVESPYNLSIDLQHLRFEITNMIEKGANIVDIDLVEIDCKPVIKREYYKELTEEEVIERDIKYVKNDIKNLKKELERLKAEKNNLK